MKLSAEQFAELASSFGSTDSVKGHERRRAARLDLQARIKITPVVSGRRLDAMYVMCCDFSARGIAFLHSTVMPIGRQFITELPRKEGGIVELLCTVAHNETVGHNVFRIGAEFTCVLHPATPTNASNDESEMKRIRASMLK